MEPFYHGVAFGGETLRYDFVFGTFFTNWGEDLGVGETCFFTVSKLPILGKTWGPHFFNLVIFDFSDGWLKNHPPRLSMSLLAGGKLMAIGIAWQHR